MILLYVALLALLLAARLLIAVRVGRLEKKYMRVSRQAQELASQPVFKQGNGARPDPYKAAKHQYELGRVAQKRDRVEARYTAWQSLSERVSRLTRRLTAWRGRTAPYLVGALDTALAVAALQLLGYGDHLHVQKLLEVVCSR